MVTVEERATNAIKTLSSFQGFTDLCLPNMAAGIKGLASDTLLDSGLYLIQRGICGRPVFEQGRIVLTEKQIDQLEEFNTGSRQTSPEYPNLYVVMYDLVHSKHTVSAEGMQALTEALRALHGVKSDHRLLHFHIFEKVRAHLRVMYPADETLCTDIALYIAWHVSEKYIKEAVKMDWMGAMSHEPRIDNLRAMHAYMESYGPTRRIRPLEFGVLLGASASTKNIAWIGSSMRLNIPGVSSPSGESANEVGLTKIKRDSKARYTYQTSQTSVSPTQPSQTSVSPTQTSQTSVSPTQTSNQTPASVSIQIPKTVHWDRVRKLYATPEALMPRRLSLESEVSNQTPATVRAPLVPTEVPFWPDLPDIVVHKLQWMEHNSIDHRLLEKPTMIVTLDTVMSAFEHDIAPEVIGKIVMNKYFETQWRLPMNTKMLTSAHLQLIARTDAANLDGNIQTEASYPGVDIHLMRLLRCIAKGSVVVSKVNTLANSGNAVEYNAEVVIIDQAGYKWQHNRFDSGGVFFYANQELPWEEELHLKAWRETCYEAFFDKMLPEKPSKPISISWNNVRGEMCEDQLVDGFKIEFLQALCCANLAPTHVASNYQHVYFRFLKAGFESSENTLETESKAAIAVLRMQGILAGLRVALHEKENGSSDYTTHLRFLELPSSEKDNPLALLQIQDCCHQLGIIFVGAGKPVDALAKIDYHATILAVTNCSNTHAAIGNEGSESTVNGRIRLNTDCKHMIIGARMGPDVVRPEHVTEIDIQTGFLQQTYSDEVFRV